MSEINQQNDVNVKMKLVDRGKAVSDFVVIALVASPIGAACAVLMRPATYVVTWDAVSAIATLAATLVALWASVNAIRGPERDRRRDRKEATHEIMSATAEVIRIFNEAWDHISYQDPALPELASLADHARLTLDRLISRPSLTDGAIATGVGAMQLAGAVVYSQLALDKGTPEFIGRAFVSAADREEVARKTMVAAKPVVKIVEDRANRVSIASRLQ